MWHLLKSGVYMRVWLLVEHSNYSNKRKNIYEITNVSIVWNKEHLVGLFKYTVNLMTYLIRSMVAPNEKDNLKYLQGKFYAQFQYKSASNARLSFSKSAIILKTSSCR